MKLIVTLPSSVAGAIISIQQGRSIINLTQRELDYLVSLSEVIDLDSLNDVGPPAVEYPTLQSYGFQTGLRASPSIISGNNSGVNTTVQQ